MHTRHVGKYEILEEIGRGGFGTVYRARDTMLDRVVAFKVLHPQLLVDPTFLTRFQQEARTAAGLKHPHIVTIHELGETEGVWYIAMEFLEGRPLDRIIRDEGPLEAELTLSIARDIGAALDYAHDQDLIHRDVKSSNILVGADGHATLTDFGLVRAAQMSTVSTTMGLVGTPAYMSPEQCEGEELDGRSDLYALGVVLYEMLAGRAPFQADTPLAVMRGHADKAPPLPRTLNPDLPKAVEAVLLRALAKGPDERYQSGADLSTALAGALEPSVEPGAPVPVNGTEAPDTAPLPASQPAARAALPRWIWIVVSVVLVALMVLVGGLIPHPPPPTTPTASPTRRYTATPPLVPTSSPPVTRTRVPTPTATVTPWLSETPTRTPTPTSVPPTTTSTRTPTPTDAPPTATSTHTPTPTATPMVDTAPPPCTASGQTWTRPADGMRMVCVPAGEFDMGSTLEKVEAILAACSTCRRESFTDELPLHVVYLNAYWIDRTEVTNGQYRECVQAGACAAPTTCDAGVSAYLDLSKENYPVACVSWNDAVAYAAWVGGRLPTEAEWEKSARGTDRRAYPWGDAFDGNRLNFCDRNCAFDWKDTTADDGFAETAPVGSYPAGASPYGALDMAGNVWEWVSDSYTSDYYSNSPPLNPQGPSSGEHRIMRGGSFDSGFRFVRCAKRWLDFRRLTNVGFRVAVESAPSEQ